MVVCSPVWSQLFGSSLIHNPYKTNRFVWVKYRLFTYLHTQEMCGLAHRMSKAVLLFGATMRVSSGICIVSLPTECQHRPPCGIVHAGHKAVNQKDCNVKFKSVYVVSNILVYVALFEGN